MEEGSPLFKILLLRNYQFYLELLIPLLILMMFSNRRKYFWLILPFACIVPCFLYWIPHLTTDFYDFTYITVSLFLFLISLTLYKESIPTLLCASMIGFGVQHIAWNFTGFFYDIMPNNAADWPMWGVVLLWAMVYLLVYSCFFLVVYKLKRPYRWQKKDSLSLFFGTILILVSLILSQYVYPWTILSRIYTIVLMFLGIALEFIIPLAHEAGSKAKQLEDEKETLTSLLELQAHQAEMSKKEQEILNMKFHDMKHQIIALKSLDGEERNQTLKELEKSIDVYGDYAKTGNNTLDIILTQKSLLCTEENITFTYIIDGNAFSFMSVNDLSSLFGNLIDNAIEAASKEEGECRLIKISASVKNGFLSLNEENYVSDKISFSSDGLPISTKENQVYHGFGTKSIKYIARKYGGTYSFTQKGNRFHVSLLFPLKK